MKRRHVIILRLGLLLMPAALLLLAIFPAVSEGGKPSKVVVVTPTAEEICDCANYGTDNHHIIVGDEDKDGISNTVECELGFRYTNPDGTVTHFKGYLENNCVTEMGDDLHPTEPDGFFMLQDFSNFQVPSVLHPQDFFSNLPTQEVLLEHIARSKDAKGLGVRVHFVNYVAADPDNPTARLNSRKTHVRVEPDGAENDHHLVRMAANDDIFPGLLGYADDLLNPDFDVEGEIFPLRILSKVNNEYAENNLSLPDDEDLQVIIKDYLISVLNHEYLHMWFSRQRDYPEFIGPHFSVADEFVMSQEIWSRAGKKTIDWKIPSDISEETKTYNEMYQMY